MLTYDLKKEPGGLPLYEQLYRCIREDILTGRLPTREKLPSKRLLAEHLHLSVITVVNAYERLTAEGFLESRQRQGYFVAPTNGMTAGSLSASAAETGAGGGAGHPAGIAAAQTTGSLAAPISGNAGAEPTTPGSPAPSVPCTLDLETNSTARTHFPFSVWARLMRRMLTDPHQDLLSRPSFSGTPALREAIAEHLYRFRGLSVDPECVLVGSGTEYLYGMLIHLLGRDRVYGLETPGYPKTAAVYRAEGVSPCLLPHSSDAPALHLLRGDRNEVLHISPSHHFPTGTVLSPAGRTACLSWLAAGRDRLIIEDEYDSEFRMTGKPMPPLCAIDRSGRVIYLNTFSKTIAPSVRIGYMVLPAPLMAQAREKLGFYTCPVSSFLQYTLADFIRQGYFERHINRMRTFYRGVRDALLRAFTAPALSRFCSVHEEDAGLHFLLRMTLPCTDRELVALFSRAGIRIAPLSAYTAAQNRDTRTLVVHYSGADPAAIAPATDRLAQLLSTNF